MTASASPRGVAVKKAVPRKTPGKTVADKNVVGAGKTVQKKVSAPRKRRTPAERTAAPAVRPEERRHLIEDAAYYIAERGGFHGSSSYDDWLQAEREIDAMIAAGKFAD